MAKWQDSYRVNQPIEFRIMPSSPWSAGRVSRKTSSGKLIVALDSGGAYAADVKGDIRPRAAQRIRVVETVTEGGKETSRQTRDVYVDPAGVVLSGDPAARAAGGKPMHPHGADGGLGRPDARDAVADNEGEEDVEAEMEALGAPDLTREPTAEETASHLAYLHRRLAAHGLADVKVERVVGARGDVHDGNGNVVAKDVEIAPFVRGSGVLVTATQKPRPMPARPPSAEIAEKVLAADRLVPGVLDVLIERAVEEGAFADFYKAKKLITKLLEGERRAAYRDAARIVMECATGGVSVPARDPSSGAEVEGAYLPAEKWRTFAAPMAERMLGRAEGAYEHGTGRLPSESTTDHAIWRATGCE
jgi:hypothetical protein